MKIQTVSIGSITPYARNPRRNESAVDKVAASIKEFGFKQPIVVDKDRVIIVGHTRLLAAERLGIKEVPIIIARDLTPTQAKAYRLADNRVHDEVEWDQELLALELGDLSKAGFTLATTGFDVDEIAKLLHIEETGLISGVDEDAVPAPPKTPVSRRGDIFTLGRHRLLCGDSTKESDVSMLLGRSSTDLCFTSPPYNAAKNSHLNDRVSGFKYKYKSNADADALSDEDYLAFLRAFTYLAIKKSRYCMVNLQMLAHNRIAVTKYQYEFRTLLKDVFIWHKRQAPPNIVKGAFNTRFEFIFCFSRDCKTRGFPCNWQGKYPNVVETESNSANEFADEHKAGFPVAFPEWFLQRLDFARTIFDPFGGTGTTMIAAEKQGRSAFLMELEPAYCDVIINRWERATGQKSTKSRSG